jgi:hypothetical protein
MKNLLKILKTFLIFLAVFFEIIGAETLNPFEVDFPVKKGLTYEDYELLQEKIRQKDLSALIDSIYPENWSYPKEDLHLRCSAFLRQTMIDRQKGLFPVVELLDGEEDSKNCVVMACSIDKKYPQLLKSLVGAIREVGYKGAIYYRIGGFPNPSGEEVRYAAVPYAMKMFMIQEAHSLGFEQILWLDCSAWPLKSLDYCFDQIEKEGCIMEWGRPNSKLVLPQTRAILENYSKVHLDKIPHVAGWLLGFKMTEPYVKKIFEDFYILARKGTPFLSITPEEAVLSALMAQHGPKLKPHANLMLAANAKDAKLMEAYKKGVKFIIRHH